jgi:aspartyl-tRNA(Asn)/glutamyl-tRNA(Gln) amidotransferase subunit C
MAEVNEALTKKVADLARLYLTDQEVSLYTTQMQTTLGYVDQLTACDTTGIEPMYHPLEIETPMREDVIVNFPTDENGKPKILKHAPEVLYDGFKVPPIIG